MNFTKEAIWSREAVLPELGAVSMPTAEQMEEIFSKNGELPDYLEISSGEIKREEQQDEYLRDIELDPALYTPPDVARDLVTHLPPTLKIPIKEIIRKKASPPHD